jgi:VanZ family protein
MDTHRFRQTAFPIALATAIVTILYFALTPVEHKIVEDINDKLNHLLAFAVLAFLADYSFPRTRLSLIKILALLGFGFLIEVLQYFLPYREFSLYDLLADGIGIAAYGFSQPLHSRIPWLRFRWPTPP